MTERTRPATLTLTVRGVTFAEMLTEAAEAAAEFFGDTGHAIVRFDTDVDDELRTVGNSTVRRTYRASAAFVALPPRRPGDFDAGPEPDDTEEVPIP